MKKAISLLLAATLLLPGCMTWVSRDTSVCKPAVPAVPHQLSRHISFSVEVRNNYDPGSWFTPEEAKETVRERLKASGLFESVYHTSLKNASENHLHFNFEESGTSFDNKMLVAFAYGVIPAWLSMDLNSAASVIVQGKEVDCYHSKWEAKDIIWLPLIVATPFCNHATTGQSMLEDSIDELLEQVKANRR